MYDMNHLKKLGTLGKNAEQAMKAFEQELETLREQITSPDTSIPLVLTILLALETDNCVYRLETECLSLGFEI